MSQIKQCTKCLQYKSQDQFVIKNSRKNLYQSICKPCQALYTREWYKINTEKHKAAVAIINKKKRHDSKNFVNKAKDVPCKDCGERYPSYVMDFDHLDGYNKISCIAKMARGRHTLKTIINEMAKCEVVCANCHRERTHKRLNSAPGET